MQYKDLIYKITSSNKHQEVKPEEMKKETSVIYNKAKQSVQRKDLLIGIMSGDDLALNKGISDSIKKEIERTLTVLFNSPISESFAFLPYDKKTLESTLELFHDRNFHFLVTKEDFEMMNSIRKEKINFKTLIQSDDIKKDFFEKIDYLVTINIDELETDIQSTLNTKKIMVFPMTFRGTENLSQKEKLVSPDPSGWTYNSANGMWVKTWGWDGKQELPSWSAPDDWNLNPNPDINTGA